MTPDLATLIERLEKATGPDKILDCAIHYDALGFCRHVNLDETGAQSDTGFTCAQCGADSWGNKGNLGQRLYESVPTYTASIDAALTLVKDDSWTIADHDDNGKYFAMVGDHECLGANPAIALCIASLRARLELTKGVRS